jgi:hypothetical protein
MSSLGGTDCILKHYLNELRLQKVKVFPPSARSSYNVTKKNTSLAKTGIPRHISLVDHVISVHRAVMALHEAWARLM